MQVNKLKLQRFSYILNALIFFSGFWSMLEQGNHIHAIILLIASFFNLFLIKNKSYRDSARSIIFIQILNAFTAFLTALNYISLGSKYIHFVWLLAALISILVIPLFIRKHKKM